MIKSKLLVVIVYSCLFVVTLHAKENSYELYRKHTNVGVMALYENSYLGDNDMSSLPFLYFDIENKYVLIRNDRGILYRAYENNRFLFNLGIAYYPGRIDKMSKEELKGLEEIPLDIPLVVSSSFYLGKGFDFTLRYEQSLRDTNVQKYRTYITKQQRLAEGVYLEAEITYSMASIGYVDRYFSVSQRENDNSEFFNNTTEFRGGGITPYSTDFSLYFVWDFAENYNLLLGYSGSYLLGKAVKSEIVEKGSKYQQSYLLSIMYKFN